MSILVQMQTAVVLFIVLASFFIACAKIFILIKVYRIVFVEFSID